MRRFGLSVFAAVLATVVGVAVALIDAWVKMAGGDL